MDCCVSGVCSCHVVLVVVCLIFLLRSCMNCCMSGVCWSQVVCMSGVCWGHVVCVCRVFADVIFGHQQPISNVFHLVVLLIVCGVMCVNQNCRPPLPCHSPSITSLLPLSFLPTCN